MSSDAPAAETDRDALVQKLTEENRAMAAQAAQAKETAERYEKRELQRIGAWKDDAQYFLKTFVNDEIENHHEHDRGSLLHDVKPLQGWSDVFDSKEEISEVATGLAATTYIASRGIKRMQAEASKHAEIAAASATVHKENEELKSKMAKLEGENTALNELAELRQDSLAKLNAKICQMGGAADTFDFTKMSSREQGAPPAEPHTLGAGAGLSLEMVKAEASKQAVGRAVTQSKGGDLLSDLLGRANGSLRMTSSGTQHALLGASNGEADIASILRSRPL